MATDVYLHAVRTILAYELGQSLLDDVVGEVREQCVCF